MMTRHLLGLAIATLGCVLWAGCAEWPERPDGRPDARSEQPEPTSLAEHVSPPVVARDAWLTTYQDTLRDELCGDDQVYRACYNVSEGDCRAHVSQVSQACEQRYRWAMPEGFTEHQGQRWAEELGKCAGTGLYEVFSASYAFRETDACNRILSHI